MSRKGDKNFTQPTTSAFGKIADKLLRTVSDADDTKDPVHHGYQRVAGGDSRRDDSGGGTLSASTTATSLDTILLDDSSSPLVSSRQKSPIITLDNRYEREFTPIFEDDGFNPPPSPRQINPIIALSSGDVSSKHKSSSKQSLKGSRVSFDTNQRKNDSSDEDNFEDRRGQYQQQRTVSVDHKGILKDLKNILDNDTDNRKAFQSKKHVSLDVKKTTFLQDLLKDSSSEEEFHKNRRDFQGRKHQSLDPRVSFKLEKENTTTSSSDEEGGDDKKLLIHKYRDITKPVIIDFKDLESDDEDLISTRNSFQQQRQISIESRKSHKFFEMGDLNGGQKDENLRNAVPYVRQITEDGKPKLEVYRPTTNPIYITTQVFAALTVSLGSMVVGFASAYSSPAVESMKDTNITNFNITKEEESWVGGMMPLAGLVGSIIGGPSIEYLGRKNTILLTAFPFILSSVLIACAYNISMVLIGRAITGLCVGIASLSLPVYLGETIQPEVRGTLGLLPTAFGNIGILLVFTCGKYLDWSQLALLGAAIPIPFLVLMFFIPETPRWFVSRGREDRARKALVWLRGREADVEPELKGIVRSHSDAERHANTNTFFELIKLQNLKPLMISLGLMFFQQLTGINAVIFYTVTIFNDAGSTINPFLCTIIVGIVNFIATFIATMLIDRLGRKMLLYISSSCVITTLLILGGFFYAKEHEMAVSSIGWLPLSSFVIYVIGFSLGFGPIPWLMMGEILPAKIRGSAASVATSFNWTCTFVVTKTFITMSDSIGKGGTFWFFCAITIVGLFFTIFCVPETQGKSLEDIERKMMGRVRRMSSVANIKPLSFNL